MKNWAVLAALILVVPPTSALIDTEIRDGDIGCQEDEEPVISLNSTEGGHAAEPGYFGKELCVRGDEYFELRQKCRNSEIRSFSLFDRDNSHLSMYSSYTYEVCSPRTSGYVDNTCDDGKAVLSVVSDNNTHVAEPGVLDKQLCLFQETPENITVQLSGLDGSSYYADDEQISTGKTLRIVEYPYIVSDKPAGIISYGDFIKLSRPSSDTVSLTQQASSFILPHTSGGVQAIESREDSINDRDFLQRISPSFNYMIPEQQTIRVILKPKQKIKGFTGTYQSHEIKVENKGLDGEELVVNMEADTQ